MISEFIEMSQSLPSLEALRKDHEGYLVPVYTELLGDMETPVSAYQKIASGEYSFLLESVEGGERFARYSFIGVHPNLILRFQKGILTRIENNGSGEYRAVSEPYTDPLLPIEEEMHKRPTITVTGLPRFTGGAVGYLSYDSVTHFEPRVKSPESDDLNIPEAIYCFTDALLAFDHLRHRIQVIAHVRLDENLERNLEAARQTIADIISMLQSKGNYREPTSNLISLSPAGSNLAIDEKNRFGYLQQKFVDKVKKSKEYIQAGDAIQIVLSQRYSVPVEASPLNIYRALRAINPSPYMYILDFPDFNIIGASPEVLVRAEDGIVTVRPIAGTRRRGKTEDEDSQLENELKSNPKEVAEHIMLVDLGRNDVGRVSQPGTVQAEELMVIERYSHVMHLVSQVTGKIQKELSVFDVLRSAFPAGTVSGAPKIRAMEIISELEESKRNVYAGAVGYFGYNGNMDTAIAIRTLILKDGCAYVQSGAGIVADSIPEQEFQETLNKARGVFTALEQAERIEEAANVGITR